MLVNMREMMAAAKRGRYGVGFFNAVDVEMARAVIETAEELSAPVMIGTAEVLLSAMPLERVRLCDRVSGRVALSGVAAWFDPVAVRRQRLCGCAWVAASRRRRAVSLRPREEGPRGEDAARLHRRAGFWVKSGDDSTRVSAGTVTWGNVVKPKYPGRSVALSPVRALGVCCRAGGRVSLSPP